MSNFYLHAHALTNLHLSRNLPFVKHKKSGVRTMTRRLPEFYKISDEIQDALAHGRPIVGLESSVVTGGTWPSNLETAKEVEATIRKNGAVPARIAVFDGKLLVGIEQDLLSQLASSKHKAKVSTRDLAHAISKKEKAGTTVSASLIACEQTGISVFSVAGIGGVHYGASESFDISTDLTQMARCRVAVVCAGAKSMLDPALTLEVLETFGVPVIGYRWEHFPGYYTQKTSQKVPFCLNDWGDIVKLANVHWGLVQTGSILITHPLPIEFSLDETVLDKLIRDAVATCRERRISGQAITPEILKIVSAATDGKSDLINRAALISTARVAADAAVAFAKEILRHV